MISMIVFAVFAQAAAPTHPSAEMFKNFPPAVYEAAKRADSAARFAEGSLRMDTEFLSRKEKELQTALDGADAVNLGKALAQYLNACEMVTLDGTGLIAADSNVTMNHATHLEDRRTDIAVYTQWLKQATAYEATFPAVAGDPALIKRAYARFEELAKEFLKK